MYFCWNIRLCVWTNKRGTVMSVRIFFNVSKIIPKRRDNFSLLRFQSTLQSINQSIQARSRWTPSYPNNNNMKLTRLPIVTEWKDNTESPNPPLSIVPCYWVARCSAALLFNSWGFNPNTTIDSVLGIGLRWSQIVWVCWWEESQFIKTVRQGWQIYEASEGKFPEIRQIRLYSNTACFFTQSLAQNTAE